MQVPLFAGDFRAVQTAGNADFDAFAAKTERRINRFAHRTAKRHALFKLQRNRFRHQRCIEFRAVYFLNVDVHFTLGSFLNVLLELVDFRAFAADDDARPRGKDPDNKFVGRAFDIDGADAGGLQFFLQFLAQLHIFVKQFSVVASGEPARLPGLVVAEAESVWMCFLSHRYPFLPFFAACCFPVNALRTRRAVPRTPLLASASATLLAWRSAAAT